MINIPHQYCRYTAPNSDNAIQFINEMRKGNGKNKLQQKTAKLWVEIFRVFTEVRRVVPSVTLRQLFYQLVSRNSIPKTEAGYKKTMRQLRSMRREKFIPYPWVADNTRWVRRPASYTDLKSFLDEQARVYRKSVWNTQNNFIEIWCEKDALAGVISDVTYSWDVPLYVTRGYSSDTLAYNAVNHYQDGSKPVKIYYFGDWDPSGKDISRDLEDKIQYFADDLGVKAQFERCAVLPEQIQEWNLPTRPTKKTDSRSKNFTGNSVELDAIPPKKLQEIIEGIIVNNIDSEIYKRTVEIEKVERENLDVLIKKLDLGSSFSDEVQA